MIEETKLREICIKYGIDYEKLIKNNNNILDYGEYSQICRTLDFLRNDVHIVASNVEKCPSILYFSTKNIRDNWEFLNRNNVRVRSIETCLHILSTENEQLQETYNYIIENYGVRYLNAITSILRVKVSRIKEIESKFNNELRPKNILRAAVSRHTIEEIEKIVKVRTAEEIGRIVEVCKRNKIEITGNVFLRTAEEIEKIVEICKENKIEITGSVFYRTAEEIGRIVSRRNWKNSRGM